MLKNQRPANTNTNGARGGASASEGQPQPAPSAGNRHATARSHNAGLTAAIEACEECGAQQSPTVKLTLCSSCRCTAYCGRRSELHQRLVFVSVVNGSRNLITFVTPPHSAHASTEYRILSNSCPAATLTLALLSFELPTKLRNVLILDSSINSTASFSQPHPHLDPVAVKKRLGSLINWCVQR